MNKILTTDMTEMQQVLNKITMNRRAYNPVIDKSNINKLRLLLNFTTLKNDTDMEQTEDINYCHALLNRNIVESITVWGRPKSVQQLLKLEQHCNMIGVEILLNNGETPLHFYSYKKVQYMINCELKELQEQTMDIIQQNNIPLSRVASIDDYLEENKAILKEFDIEMMYTPMYIEKQTLYKANKDQLQKWGYDTNHKVFEKKETQVKTEYYITLKDKLNAYVQLEYYKNNYEDFKDIIECYENSAILASDDMQDTTLTQEERREFRRNKGVNTYENPIYTDLNFSRLCY